MSELKALSKLKLAGKLHYWSGTIEIDERELREICDEIQAEHDKAVAVAEYIIERRTEHDSVGVGLVKGKVHDRHEISEYYCGGCGYPVTDHDSYCRECGGALHKAVDWPNWFRDSRRYVYTITVDGTEYNEGEAKQ